MNLEIGKYVRYTRSMINGNVAARIAKIVDCSDNELIKIDNGQCILREDIIKARHKIIDLIEVGDYVNGYLVTAVSKDVYGETIVFVGQKLIEEAGYYRSYYSKDIKTIVTKEQFKSEKYEVMNND